MSSHYIGNNQFIKVAVQNLFSFAEERYYRSLKSKIVYFVDTGSVLTMHDLARQIIRIKKIESKACVVLIPNNHFIASVFTTDQVSLSWPVSEWVKLVNKVMPNIDEMLNACIRVLKLHGLTDAQRHLFLNLQMGKSIMQISKLRSISKKTAYAHRQAIMKMFSFLSPIHLAIYMKNEYRMLNVPIQMHDF